MSNINLQCLLGIQCNDFVMIAADQSTSHSIMVMKDGQLSSELQSCAIVSAEFRSEIAQLLFSLPISDEEKIYKISDRLVMGVIGDSGDTNQFAEYIAKNIQLYKMRNGYELGPSAAASFTRRNLAEYLRSQVSAYYTICI